MSLPCRYAAQRCARQLRSAVSARPQAMTMAAATRLRQQQQQGSRSFLESRRLESTDAAGAAETAPENPKITAIVDEISKLTLLETADLVSSLKSRLNIPDMAVGAFGGAAMAGAGPAAAAEAEEDEPEPAAAAKTVFNLRLLAFEPTAKAKVIKEVKQMLGLSLVESKKFVESAPKQLRENVPKEEAEKIIETMKGLGATVVMD